MSGDQHPRYIVKELRGYPAGTGMGETSDFMVLDRWNCHHVVYYDKSKRQAKGEPQTLSYRDRAREADRICLRMNVAHDAWLYAKDAA